jgi:hypothetical protein
VCFSGSGTTVPSISPETALGARSIRARAQADAGGRPALGRRRRDELRRLRERGLALDPWQGCAGPRRSLGSCDRGSGRGGDVQADGRRHALSHRLERVRRGHGWVRVRRHGRPRVHRRRGRLVLHPGRCPGAGRHVAVGPGVGLVPDPGRRRGAVRARSVHGSHGHRLRLPGYAPIRARHAAPGIRASPPELRRMPSGTRPGCRPSWRRRTASRA